MNKPEKLAYQILLQDGYLVEKPRRTKWLPQDFFYCWDFIAVNNEHIRFIQVSTQYFSSRPKEYQERLKNFPKPPNTTKEYWRYDKKSKSFVIQLL